MISSPMAAQANVMMNNLGLIANTMAVLAIFMGITLFLSGVFHLKRYGESRTMMSQQLSIWGPGAMILAGILLLLLPYTIATSLRAFFGDGQTLPLAYQPTGEYDFDVYIPVVLAFVRVIGVGAMIRACFLLSKSGGHSGQPGTIGKAMVHIFGGILCVHVLGTEHLIKYLFDINT